jgi:predicted acetyltransferase
MNEILKLVFPTKEYEEKAKKYIKEFKDYNSEINGVGGLDRYDNYDEWLIKIENDLDINKVEKGKVPGSTFFLVRESDDRILGMINIRHSLNDYLLKLGGNIGYSIRPTERRKGYATKILYLGLEKCKELNIDKVLVTCDKSNIGSAKTIQNNGGRLENEVKKDETSNEMVQRYWIDLGEI